MAGPTPTRDGTSGRGDATEAVAAPVLITGGRGFAGTHLARALHAHGRAPSAPSRSELDLLDPDATGAAVRSLRPRTIFHLAAFSSPGRSLDRPEEALIGNVRMTLNLLEAVRAEAPAATVVLVGSGQIYGAPDGQPITEDALPAPRNPYAVSKATADMLGHQYAVTYGLRIVRARPFNHAGPGQSDEYVLGTLARQVAEAELAGARETVLHTGDVSVARDFTDVRDVVRAYELLAVCAEPAAYNVCSGRATRLAELIDLLRSFARVEIRQEVDPARLRRDDPRELRGSRDRISDATGWEPEIALARTVADALESWRSRLAL